MRDLLMNAAMPNMQGQQMFGQQGMMPPMMQPQFDMYGQQQGGLRQALMMGGMR